MKSESFDSFASKNNGNDLEAKKKKKKNKKKNKRSTQSHATSTLQLIDDKTTEEKQVEPTSDQDAIGKPYSFSYIPLNVFSN